MQLVNLIGKMTVMIFNMYNNYSFYKIDYNEKYRLKKKKLCKRKTNRQNKKLHRLNRKNTFNEIKSVIL